MFSKGLKPGEKGDGLIIRGVHRVLINSLNKDEETEHTVSELAAREALQPLIAFRKLNQNVNTREIYVKTAEERILRNALPKCVNLLTLEAYHHFKIVRFEHLYGKIVSLLIVFLPFNCKTLSKLSKSSFNNKI